MQDWNIPRRDYLGVALMMVLSGCKPAHDSAASSTIQAESSPAAQTSVVAESLEVGAVASELDALIGKQHSVTFRSWNGKWIGMDSDTDLTFLPNHAAHMFEYGYGIRAYDGTYTIDSKGEVSMQFPKFARSWPVMSLRRDAASLLLRPKISGMGSVMGNRGGATISGNPNNYWPFRPLNLAHEAEVVKRMGKK